MREWERTCPRTGEAELMGVWPGCACQMCSKPGAALVEGFLKFAHCLLKAYNRRLSACAAGNRARMRHAEGAALEWRGRQGSKRRRRITQLCGDAEAQCIYTLF